MPHDALHDCSPAAALSARRLTKRFGRLTALDAVDLEVARGETVVLWGPNGAGKTTLLRCLLGIVPYEGQASVLGLDARRQGREARRLLGYAPQEVRFPIDEPVSEVCTFYARLRQVEPRQADALLDEWGLTALAATPVGALSGGMKQKLALAVALLGDPPILLLDEPASHLDVATRHELMGLLRRLAERGKTLLLCSHRAGDIWRLAQRVIVLRQGRKVADGPPEAAAAELGGRAILWITVPEGRAADAALVLSRHGFSVHPNGAQLWVGGTIGRRAEPLARLQEAGIPVLDLDVESEG